MRIIRNKFIPFGHDFLAINLFGIVFAKTRLNDTVVNHEFIHTLQQRELLFVFFYLIYIIEYLFRIIQYRSFKKGYYHISFEQEAYKNERNLAYKQMRKHYAWIEFLKKGKT